MKPRSAARRSAAPARRSGATEEISPQVWHTHLGKGAPVYHGAEHPHLHVVCQSCGEISSVAPDLLDGAAERLAADLGFTVDVGHVALSGTCRACRERAGSEHT